MVKCGYFSYREYTQPYRCIYKCEYFGFIAGAEKILCAGCTLDKKGIPHIKELEESFDDEEDDKNEQI